MTELHFVSKRVNRKDSLLLAYGTENRPCFENWAIPEEGPLKCIVHFLC